MPKRLRPKKRRKSRRQRANVELKPLRRELDGLVRDGKAEQAVEVAWTFINELCGKPLTDPAAQSSERIKPGVLKKKLGELEAGGVLEEVDAIEVDDDRGFVDPILDEKAAPRRSRHGRRRLPAELPREIEVIPVDEADRDCPGCGRERCVIGYETSEVLEFVPAHFKVIEYRREQRGCPGCRQGIATAPVADKIYDRAMAGPQLLGHVAVARYCDHLPFTRQSRIFARLGLPIATSTLCGWGERVADDLEPVAELIFVKALDAFLLQTDSTGLKVLDRSVEENITLGHLWFYVGDRRYVAVRYTETGEGATGPWLHLAGREGYTQADATKTLDRVFNGRVASAIEVGCLAHARRKFVPLFDTDPEAVRALQFFQLIYAMEKVADVRGYSFAARGSLRQERSRPLLDKLFRWADVLKTRRPPSDALSKAIGYLHNQRQALYRFTEDPRIPLDNTEVERQIRIVALDRNNSLFAGSHAGARRAAVMYSIICTCNLAGVDPQAYIADVLVKIAGGWPAAKLDALLPHRWAEGRSQAQTGRAELPSPPEPVSSRA